MANVPTRDYPVLWDLVKTPTLDALSKIRFYQQLRKTNAASLDAIMGVERSGYKSLFYVPVLPKEAPCIATRTWKG